MKRRLRKKAFQDAGHRLHNAAVIATARATARAGRGLATPVLLEPATAALGNAAKAAQWLQTSNRALSGNRPVDVAATAEGSGQVRQVLGRLEHGVFS